MLRILATILFLISFQLVQAQKETNIKIHFDGNLGLELEREVAPRFSLTLKGEYNVNQTSIDLCKPKNFSITSPSFSINADTFPIFNFDRYDIFTVSIGSRFYPFADGDNLGLYTGLALNYQHSKNRDEPIERENRFFVEIPLGYKWRFAKRFLFEFGFTTGFNYINNPLCSNHNKLALNGAYFLMAGYQITKNNKHEKESIHPTTK